MSRTLLGHCATRRLRWSSVTAPKPSTKVASGLDRPSPVISSTGFSQALATE
ncbi:hypothetical protein V5E97_01245 [Singulisphaera sp. Ch08]|uniref:Uncharacterized protein n=1 Tax=Singulisphaera sp. Ch08 TaxID=3120278 RepID=A0AAU7CHY2_9BACT